MLVKFRSKKWRNIYDNRHKGDRELGEQVARKYHQRVSILEEVDSINKLCLQHPNLHCHKLTGDRKGQWALNLKDQWRLIFSYDETTKTVTIEEVSNHYD
ncbi:MAG: plasmid maintenance system killer [Ignavibacteriales bacterium]|nr:plasmid maintenance system killer [Ignavibacteriales bacterium]